MISFEQCRAAWLANSLERENGLRLPYHVRPHAILTHDFVRTWPERASNAGWVCRKASKRLPFNDADKNQ
jgi:hypothetical protein